MLAVAVAFAALHVAHAQNAPPELPTLHLSAQLVLLDATVEDRKSGKVIEGLTPADFVLTEDGVPQPVTYVSEDRLPLSISLLFDITDTVQPVLKPLAAGSREFLSRLRPEDEVAVLTFSNHVSVLQPFTLDHSLVEAAIAHASTLHDRNSPTFIHESVYAATEITEGATIPNSRRVEVWLTDGTSNYATGPISKMGNSRDRPDYIHSREEATDRLTRSGAVVSVLIERSAATDAQLPLMPLFGHVGEINRYAELSGGPVLHTARADVARNLAALIDILRHRYTLGFKPTVAKPPGTLCHLTLTLSPAYLAAHPNLPHRAILIRSRQTYQR